MRQIASHKVNYLNNVIDITVMDEPGAGGACHAYAIDLPVPEGVAPGRAGLRTLIKFQEGPPAEGINGISQEALLAVLHDRLTGFQSGQYACHENAMALVHIQAAINWLKLRTKTRTERGVEGLRTP